MCLLSESLAVITENIKVFFQNHCISFSVYAAQFNRILTFFVHLSFKRNPIARSPDNVYYLALRMVSVIAPDI